MNITFKYMITLTQYNIYYDIYYLRVRHFTIIMLAVNSKPAVNMPVDIARTPCSAKRRVSWRPNFMECDVGWRDGRNGPAKYTQTHSNTHLCVTHLLGFAFGAFVGVAMSPQRHAAVVPCLCLHRRASPPTVDHNWSVFLSAFA